MTRALSPLAVMAASGYSRSVKPAEVIGALKVATRIGTYISSGEAARDSADARQSRIRQGLTDALRIAHLTVPRGALEPLLDYLAAKLAAESVGTAGADSGTAQAMPGSEGAASSRG